MMNLADILKKTSPLPVEDFSLLENIFDEVEFNKGTILFNQDKTERKFYFIKRGIARAFTTTDGNDITFWFGQEGDPILSINSYISNKAGYETIELLEDAILYETSNQLLNELYESNKNICNWGRKLAENELIKTEQRFIARLTGNSKQRYEYLIHNYPGLINRVQLGYIASYLGITQVSLSRIRK